MWKYGLILFLLLLLFLVQPSAAQDFSSLKGQKAFSFHGSIGGGADFYHSNESYLTRDPFAWNLYGNFTPAFYGLSLPFSFLINQYSRSYTSPFAQFGISPTYKWVKVHIGYRTISMSPLVFDGQSFLGAGIELSPKGFYLAAFYGRLNKAVTEDTTYGHTLAPQYQRTGYGVKIGVGGKVNNFSLQLFHAKDDSSSIRRPTDTLVSLAPQENTVLGASLHLRFFRKLTFSADAATSLLTQDQAFGVIDSINNTKIPGLIKNIAPFNYSSVVSFAGQSNLTLLLRSFSSSIGYRRVQPDFKSLGTPYSLSDVEMIFGTVSTSLDKGKVSLSASLNSQHNDLSHMLSSELQTQTGNLSLNVFANQHLNVSGNVTAVQVYQRNGVLALTDSVRMNQLMLSASLSPSLTFSGLTRQQTVSLSLNYTTLMDHNPATHTQTAGDNITSSLAYSLFFSRAFWGLSGILQYSQYTQPQSTYQSAGLNVGANAQLLKSHALGVQGSVGYFLNHNSTTPAANNTTFSLSGNYAVQQHHSLGVYTNYLITPPVNLNPLNTVNHVPYAVNSKNLAGGVTYAYHF